MSPFPSIRPVLRATLGLSPCVLARAAQAASDTGAANPAAGVDASPWTLAGVLLALCALAMWRWFRRLPDEVGRAGGWRAMLWDVALRNGVAAVVAWQLGAGVFRGVLARYAQGHDAMALRAAMPIALAAATVGFLVARWLMVFVQRAWRRRRGVRV